MSKQNTLFYDTLPDGCQLRLHREIHTNRSGNNYYKYYVILDIGEGGNYEMYQYSNEKNAWQCIERTMRNIGNICCNYCGQLFTTKDYIKTAYRGLYRNTTGIACYKCLNVNKEEE